MTPVAIPAEEAHAALRLVSRFSDDDLAGLGLNRHEATLLESLEHRLRTAGVGGATYDAAVPPCYPQSLAA
ncbi:MAG TPA: hypothetical protein VFM56_07260 [Solimonas sp.]|nr:hypothetical protein [Solimonas sp.]